MKTYIILNSAGRFFNGTWAEIKWTSEYPSARVYNSIGVAKRETRKLRAEILNENIRLIENYGLDTEKEVMV
jgi:hypothetical protein